MFVLLLRIANGLDNCALCALIEPIQRSHVILVELKVVNVSVADNPRRIVTLGQRYESLLQTPSNENLVGFLVVFLSDSGERCVVCLFVADNGAVGFDYNVAFFAVVDDFTLLAPRVELV